jgi:hypothetical protein
MTSNFAALSARMPACVSRIGPLVALLALTLLSACTNHQESPHALWAHLQELSAAGDNRAIWKLYTENERERQSGAWDQYKEFLRRNPEPINREKCLQNWRVSPEEFTGLAHIEIFELANEGTEGAMVDARIIDDEPATDLENAHRIYWVTAVGEKCSMLAQHVDGEWWLVTLRE